MTAANPDGGTPNTADNPGSRGTGQATEQDIRDALASVPTNQDRMRHLLATRRRTVKAPALNRTDRRRAARQRKKPR